MRFSTSTAFSSFHEHFWDWKKPIEKLTQQFNFTIDALIKMPNKQSELTNDETNKIANEVKSLWSKNELFRRYLWNAVGMDSSY